MSETSPERKLVFQEESLLLTNKQERTTELICKPLPAEDKGTNSEFVPGLVPLTGWATAVREQMVQLVWCVGTAHLADANYYSTNDKAHTNLSYALPSKGENSFSTKKQELVLMPTSCQQRQMFDENNVLVPGLTPLTEWMKAEQEQNSQLLPGVLTTHPTSPHCCNTRDREHTNLLLATFGEEETFLFTKEQETMLPPTARLKPEGVFVETCELVTGALPFSRLLATTEGERAELVL